MNKEKDIAETFECFLSNFGKIDDITLIVLEEIFNKILNEKSNTLHISSEKRQD